MHYRVDNIPLTLKPFFLLYGYVLGFLMFAVFAALHFLCRIRIQGRVRLQGRSSNFIYCMWHENVFPYFIGILRHDRPHMWMNHPAWYMKPIHVAIRLVGVRGLVLGSTGNDGQEAAGRLASLLKEGYSTLMMPDGPAGPPKVLKKGVLHMALQSGVPIVPMRIVTPRQIVLKRTWDGKRIPLPLSIIRVIYQEPIAVTEANFAEAEKRLVSALG
jgi:lysophospholipid acyltransferase (LPLAT)-like uncharacterized protein